MYLQLRDAMLDLVLRARLLSLMGSFKDFRSCLLHTHTLIGLLLTLGLRCKPESERAARVVFGSNLASFQSWA